jgi:hypothetical protein
MTCSWYLVFRATTLGVMLSCCSAAAVQQGSDEEVHLGGCILRSPVAEAPQDLYQRTAIEPAQDYRPFTKQLSVYGLTFIARDDISDGFLEAVADTVEEMFPRGEGMDAGLQAEILANLHRYRAVIPFFKGEDFEFAPADERAWERTARKNSVCDIIMEGVSGQVMEVVEHLLHFVSDVGLHYAYAEQWGISRESDLHFAMQEAIDKGYYDVSQYDDIDELEVRYRVELQEFAYWIITCAWNLQKPYGPAESEWKMLKTAEDLEQHLPLAHELIQETLPRVMVAPRRTTLDKLGK